MNQPQLFGREEPNTPRTVYVTYENSDFNGAIEAAREQFEEQVAVICVFAGCVLLPKKRNVKKKG